MKFVDFGYEFALCYLKEMTLLKKIIDKDGRVLIDTREKSAAIQSWESVKDSIPDMPALQAKIRGVKEKIKQWEVPFFSHSLLYQCGFWKVCGMVSRIDCSRKLGINIDTSVLDSPERINNIALKSYILLRNMILMLPRTTIIPTIIGFFKRLMTRHS